MPQHPTASDSDPEALDTKRVYPHDKAMSVLRKESLAEDAYRALKASILEGHLPSGYQAVEARIADQLAMSRTPVHEALARLQHEGLVRILPRKGVQVLPILAADMVEVYQLLTALEGVAAMLLAGNGAGVRRSVQMMDDATGQMERAHSQGDLRGWAQADDQFHRLLVTECGNRRLAKSAANLVDQAQRARSTTLKDRQVTEESVTEHRALLSAIRAGDAHGARAAVERHRARASEIILNVLNRI